MWLNNNDLLMQFDVGRDQFYPYIVKSSTNNSASSLS